MRNKLTTQERERGGVSLPARSALTKAHRGVNAAPLLRVLCALLFLLPAAFAEENNTAENTIEIREWRQWFVPPEAIRPLTVEPALPMNRQEFERLVKQLEQQSDEQRDQHPYLSNIVLRATLEGRQLTGGQGFFTLHPRTEGSGSIPLEPLTLAVHSAQWAEKEGTEGENALLVYEPERGNRLLIPSATDSNSYNQLQFQWSLQSRKDYRNGTVFDIELPPCMSIELQIALPKTLTLTSSTGLVLDSVRPAGEEDNTLDEYRTWRILLGHHSNTTLTITEDKTLPSAKSKTAIHQRVIHHVKPEGLETQTFITFDRNDARPNELILELEMPLRPTEIKYGDRTITSWTQSALSPDVTEARIDLSAFAGEEPQELLIESLGPLREEQHWVLPRVRVTSSDIFWVGTRCAVYVYSPLRARNVNCYQAVQVASRTVPDWAERELYVFQLYQDDGHIELEVVYSVPPVTVNSAAQIDLGDNEIRGTVYLECSVSDGERFTLNFPLSEHWTVDSVIPYARGIRPGESAPEFSWDVLEGVPQTLSVQLESALTPRLPIMLQLSCRFSNSSQHQFRLAELSPLALPHRRAEQQHIAVRPDLTEFSLKSSVSAPTYSVSPSLTFGNNTHVQMFGGTYPLNSRTQDIRFELERTRANFTANITGNVHVGDDGLISTFHIRCTPLDLPMSRAIIHFTPSGEDDTAADETPDRWQWSLSGNAELSRPLRVRKMTPEELQDTLVSYELQHWSEALSRGEIWEVRFEELQSVPVELSATSLIPLTESTIIPLASMPFASTQQGELTFVSPQNFNYRVVGGQHNSIPVAPPALDRYQDVRAAFRYDPMEELRRSQHTPLLLQRLTPEEQFDTAWVWSLRLDSQYDSEGTVRSRALFLVENQGLSALNITLPLGIGATNVSAVWRDSQQIPWQYESGREPTTQGTGTIAVALPVGQRFVSIALEYTHQEQPLVQQRKLRPHFPSADVPILSGSWISWFPPEFDVSLRRTTLDPVQEPEGQIRLSKALDYLLTGTYRSFFWTEWDNALYGKQRRIESEAAAQYFFDEVVDVLQNNPISTWGELLGNDKLLSTVRFQLEEKIKRSAVTKLFIDQQALTFLGITPSTRIENISSINTESVRETLFDRTGLVLLIAIRPLADGSREFALALTTPTTLSRNRQFPTASSGHSVRIVPFEFFDAASSPEWIPAKRWIQETTLFSIPWAVSAQVMQGSALTMDWNSYEMPIEAEQPLYIVHRQKFTALQWLAFLAVVLITSRKQFSSPILLFALLVAFELTARSVAPCYIGIPSGAFLGVLVSFAFLFIRAQFPSAVPLPELPLHSDSTEWSVSFVPTTLAGRLVLTCGVLLGLSASLAAQPLPEPTEKSVHREPYRVFYPVDEDGQPIGDNVSVPWELSLLLLNAKSEHLTVPQRWYITKSVYQGSLVRTALGTLECADDFKAVYDIYLDSSNATITLPDLPAVPGRYLWNSQPIQPVLREEPTSETLSFLIENETPGKHTLEIALAPQAVLRSKDTAYAVSFAVPNVPQSSFWLNVPPDALPVNVPDALGAVTPNSPASPVLTAELGPVEQLSFSWGDSPNQNGTLVNEVEQFFWVKVAPSQIELEALFRYRIDGGKIQQLIIQTDPRWSPSGQFSCREHTITTAELPSGDTPHNRTLIEFQSPVSGTITLRRDFVFRTIDGTQRMFEGIGNLRLPEFQALQSRITKSMLGVSADPLLELGLPAEGRSSGFEAGWYGTPTSIALPLFGTHPFWEITAEAFARQEEVSRERPDAAYDLTQTEPTWTLNIRAKNPIPEVNVTQSVQFDSHESRIHVVGNFSSPSPVFRHYFSTDRPIQIESIEVRNAQGFAVESRVQQIVSDAPPLQYVLFLKSPVTGNYTVTIRGFFESEVQEAPLVQSVPLLTFDDVKTTESLQNFFRTSAVIVDVPSEQTGWAKSSGVPVAPESFAVSRPLGSWQQLESVEPENESVPTPLQFTLTPNRPKVESKTMLSLLEEIEGQWIMTLDFSGSITGGELETLSFHWDDRCRIIHMVEPSATSWSIALQGGQPTLTLTSTESLREEVQFRIVVSVDTSGATVALPNVYPLARNMDSLDSAIYVDLPLNREGTAISWELNSLEAIEDQNEDSVRLLYRAEDTRFSAKISQDESRLTALLYDISFLVNRDGSMTGVVTVDLRNRGQDNFILQMPSEYEPIQISSASSILDRTRLEEKGRWRIHIGTSDYPQRLNILFRAPFSKPLRRWKREQIVSTLRFPTLEGVAVQDTIWTIAFEGNLPTLNVASALDQHWSGGTLLSPKLIGRHVNDLGDHSPLSGRDSQITLIGVNLIREYNLLRVLDSIPLSARQEEVRRWFLHWSGEWDMVADKVDFQVAHLPLSLHNVRSNLILRPLGAASGRGETAGIVRLFLETMGASTRESLRVSKDRSVSEKFGTSFDVQQRQSVPILNSPVYWQGRISDEMQYLFGAEEGAVRTITLTSLPHESKLSDWISEHVWLWISLGLLLPVFVLLLVRWVYVMELWLQFPHFWGMSIGVLFWTFLPESFIGLIIIVLTFVSFFRPSWSRHRSMTTPF